MNPQSCTVTGFKVPSKEEAANDFLWRYHQHTLGLGQIAIFKLSHYEHVLVQRVHDMEAKKVWSGRYEHINNFEKLLYDNFTLVDINEIRKEFHATVEPEGHTERRNEQECRRPERPESKDGQKGKKGMNGEPRPVKQCVPGPGARGN